MINHRNNFKTDGPFTIVANLYFACKNSRLIDYEVRAGCPKLGNPTLLCPSFAVVREPKSSLYTLARIEDG